MAPGVEQLLACGKDRVYVPGPERQTCSPWTRRRAQRIASLAAPAYRLAYTNGLTDRIYLLTDDGTLLCLREVDAYYPSHLPSAAQPPEDKEQTRRSTTAGRDRPLSPPPAAPADEVGCLATTFRWRCGCRATNRLRPRQRAGCRSTGRPTPEEPTKQEEFDDPFDFG